MFQMEPGEIARGGETPGGRTGQIFDIKEFAVFDGPGLRQTVFLKGCPMRCRWCHNPEGLISRPQMMVSRSSCTGCGRCRQACQNDPCIACGNCVLHCPLGLRRVAGKEISVSELAQLLAKDNAYYSRYGGGVTFSGGEPLMQGEFLLEVLERLPGTHTMAETCGCVDQKLFQAVVEKLDYVYMDLKMMDGDLHRRYTGMDNGGILQNARWLCEGKTPFTVRVPLIPGVTDSAENLRQIAGFLAGAKSLQGVELLPYNKMTGAKYAMLDMEYRPGFDESAPVETHQGVFAQNGIRSVVL